MSAALWQRLDLAARHLAPLGFTVLLLLVGLVPLRIPHLPPLGANLVLISVYYWGVHRPAILPPPAVFLVGVLIDLLNGAPLGVSALVLLAAYGATLSLRRWFTGATFLLVWCGYAVVATGGLLLSWIVVWLMTGLEADLLPGLSGLLVGIGLYPLLGGLFAQVQRTILR